MMLFSEINKKKKDAKMIHQNILTDSQVKSVCGKLWNMTQIFTHKLLKRKACNTFISVSIISCIMMHDVISEGADCQSFFL